MYKQFPSYNIKIVLGSINAKLGMKIWTLIAVGTCDLHGEIKVNGNVNTSHAYQL
jgi:hypothetical protein